MGIERLFQRIKWILVLILTHKSVGGTSMAIRNIIKEGDEILKKTAKIIDRIDERLNVLIDDMIDTMAKYDGVGLAAPQVGVLRRVAIIDVGEGPIVLINPKKIMESGEQYGEEGCLSVPGVFGTVKRPQNVVVEAMGRDGVITEISGDGLLARALCHEIDHLEGKLFRDLVIKYTKGDERYVNI